MLRLLIIFFSIFLVVKSVHANMQSVHEIELKLPNQLNQEQVHLPYFVGQEKSGLQTVHWRIRIPHHLSDAEIPALLIPQIVQGAQFSLRGELIYEIESSNKWKFYNWYSPVLIQIPKSLLTDNNEWYLEVKQTGHLRGWFIAPVIFGEIKDLRPLFESYVFISQTLKTTINVLCALLGIFLIVVGVKLKRNIYTYAGLISSTWSILVATALMAELPNNLWFLWRAFVYCMTGWLVFFEIMFNFLIYKIKIKKAYLYILVGFANAGWLFFVISNGDFEAYLDVVWTGVFVVIYVFTLILILRVAIQRKDWQRGIPISILLFISIGLAMHDYALHTGIFPINVPTDTQELWLNIALQPIYIAHLILPACIGMILWLLGKEHIKITKDQWTHKIQLDEQRERIVSDIHDGVGSRINLLLWSMRTRIPEPAHITGELQGCMDELRFAINPPQSGRATLHNALEKLIERLSITALNDVQIHYTRLTQSKTEFSSEIGLHIYKATQECLSNALRHSGAAQIHVFLDHRETEIEVTIRDNGQGIPGWDNDMQKQLHRRITSMGLLGVQNRMQHRNWRCCIHSSEYGTQIILSVNFKAEFYS